jgi:hypothetical protein
VEDCRNGLQGWCHPPPAFDRPCNAAGPDAFKAVAVKLIGYYGLPMTFKVRRDCCKSHGKFRPGESRMHRTHCRPMLVLLAAVAAAAALVGCGTDHAREMRDERASVFPANYRAELVAFMRTYLNDPTNVRDAYIAEPTMKPFGPRDQYVVCVRYNAKNTDGRYMGSKDGMALFDGGRFDHMIDQFNDKVINRCADADYKRFPELEALKR